MERRRPPMLSLQLKNPADSILKNLEILEPLKPATESLSIIESVIEKFKFMDGRDIRDIYNSDKINQDVKISGTRVENPTREIIQINEPAVQLFYKSKDVSRGGLDIKDVWFPFNRIEIIGQRLEKAEDKYISNWENFKQNLPFDKDVILEMIRNPDLKIYGRFINYTNASISARLYKEKF